jgi:fermentation-respiration switch protein FrsA (DUF1100 family)
MKILRVILFIFCLGSYSYGQDNTQFTEKELSINPLIDGTLLTPTQGETYPLAIIIAGSGPTDRNGNQNYLKNNSLKKLAEALSSQGIATYRYDKRIVKQIKKRNVDPNITFDHFIEDATSVVDYFKNFDAFSKLYVIGHSQGSLVGMKAAQQHADGFISLAGAGKSIDAVIMDQITATAPTLVKDAENTFAVLRQGKTTSNYPPALQSLFDISIQPFMSNWMQYNPSDELKKLDCSVLILNGTKDLQVEVSEAELLKNAKPEAQLSIIENMNHVLFTIEGDRLENSKSYNETFRPISEALITAIVEFIK